MIDQSPNPIKLKQIALLLMSIWLGLQAFNILTQLSSMVTSHHHQSSFLNYLEFFTIRVWLPWVVLTPIVLWLATRFPVKPKKWLTALVLHVFFLVFISIVSGLAISLHYHFFEQMSAGMEAYLPWQHTGHFLFGDSIFLFNTIIYTILVANSNIKNFSHIAQQKELIASQLNVRLMESQLQTLKMQINPHFLFNTLNVISVLVMKSEQEKANEMISRLSKFFRQTLDEKDQQWLPLRRELEHVAQYLGIEQVRFGQRLKIVKNYDEPALSEQVPAMLLQPLIENAMQHGLGEKLGVGHLTISCQLSESRLTITIEDDGVGCDFGNTFKAGIGISNVRSRLQQLYAGEADFTLSNNASGGVTAIIILPIKAVEEEYS